MEAIVLFARADGILNVKHTAPETLDGTGYSAKFQPEAGHASFQFHLQPDLHRNSMTSSCGQTQFTSSNARAALFIAHPGHELIVHGWLELVRPFVFVLTDGSGRTNQSRLKSTTEILNQTGAKLGSIYGRLTDNAAYSAILDREFDLFIRLAKELAEAFIAERIDYVAGDAAEGYSPTHDVCRLIIKAAVKIAYQRTGQRVANFEFPLVRPPDADRAPLHPDDIWLQLDDEAFARKLASAKGYAALTSEVLAALSRESADAYRIECLHRVDASCDTRGWNGERPFYEDHGEKQVAAGYYQRVLRYHQHIEPLAAALSCYAEKNA